MLRDHPRAADLAAWFDGEDAPGVGDHLRGCRRCRHRMVDLSRVRAAVRGEQVPPRPGLLSLVIRARAVAVVPIVVAVVMLLVASGTWPTIARPIAVAGRYLTGADPVSVDQTATTAPAHGWDKPSSPSPASPTARQATTTTTGPGSRAADGGGTTGAAAAGTSLSAGTTPDVAPATSGAPDSLAEYASAALPAAPAGAAPASPLRLGAFVPADGFDAAEGRQVTRALHRAVDAANEAGGVAGRKIELTVVPAEDAEAVAALEGQVDVIVGGFGAVVPAGGPGLDPPPWLFPAEPHPAGPSVVAAELDPAEAGRRLGEDLVARGIGGVVGVIRGDGPDRALGDGLAGVPELTVTEVEATPGTGCGKELAALRSRQVVAVAVAGPPELAARCTDARTRLAWNPRGGILVPASAAYAHLEVLPTAAGARTVLGLPWPNGDHRGAARYRAAVPGPSSYRALVSYAGVELAVQVARAKGSVTYADVMAGHWSSDLTDFEASRRAATVMEVTLGRWEPDGGRPSPRPSGSRRAR